jgi:hypothetical protein
MDMNLGAIERPKDERDFLLGAVQAPVTIPFPYFPDNSWLITNWQGQTPTCGAHGGSHFQALMEHILAPAANQRYTPRYLWIKVKQIDGYDLETGTDMRSIFKTLQNIGIANYEPLENDVTLPLTTYSSIAAITPEMDTDAAGQKISSYAFADTDFDSLCQAIYQNKAVLLLIKCDDGFWGSDTPTFTTPKYGHFVVANGCDETKIRIIDSADKDFPIKYILKQYITPTFIIEAGTAIDISPTQVQQLIDAAKTVTSEVQSSIIPAAQKFRIDATLIALLKSLASLLPKKVGTSANDKNIMIKKIFASSSTFWNWLVVSSANPQQVALTVQGFFSMTVVQTLFGLLPYIGIHPTFTLTVAGAGAASIAYTVATIITSGVTLYALLRKAIVSIHHLVPASSINAPTQ